MSPLWRKQFGIALYPDRLVLARTSGGLRPRLEHKEIIEFAPAGVGTAVWQPAIDALAIKVQAGEFARAIVNVVISNSFVHYALVPWSKALTAKDEEVAFARHCFSRVFGSEADNWELKLSRGAAEEARIAAAMERSLIDALRDCLAPLGARYRSLQPHLMASFNQSRARLGERPAWLVVAEPGFLCVSLLQAGQWQSIRTIKVGTNWINDLPALLDREECLIDSSSECKRVILFAPEELNPLPAQTGKWQMESVMPRLLPGMNAGTDAPFSVALGA